MHYAVNEDVNFHSSLLHIFYCVMVAMHINMTTLLVCGQEKRLCVFQALQLMLSLHMSTRQMFALELDCTFGRRRFSVRLQNISLLILS